MGYVGLPLAVAFAEHYDVLGFDTNAEKVHRIASGVDPTNELEGDQLSHALTTRLTISSNPTDLSAYNTFIITVPTDINAAAGLPWWVNHVAFDAPTRAALDEHRRRWTDHGHTVIEVDHDFCTSIYIRDPSQNLVEFCLTTRDFTEEERRGAQALLRDPSPDFESEKGVVIHQPTGPA